MLADGAAIFLNPIKEEVKAIMEFLDSFGLGSGLIMNRIKSEVRPIYKMLGYERGRKRGTVPVSSPILNVNLWFWQLNQARSLTRMHKWIAVSLSEFHKTHVALQCLVKITTKEQACGLC